MERIVVEGSELEDLLDLEDWLHGQIDGGEECQGHDEVVSAHIRTVETLIAKLHANIYYK